MNMTPWSRGRLDSGNEPAALLFGRMHEDWSIETAVFPPKSRVFCIASAGCTAMELASRGYRVTAVDINPVQIAYVKERLAGAPLQEGSAEKIFRLARRGLPCVGWTGTKLRTFLSMDSVVEQAQFWDEKLDRPLWRIGLAVVFQPLLLRFIYASPFIRVLPPHFHQVFRKRLQRGFQIHTNRTNPWVWQTWLGCSPLGWQPPSASPGSMTLAVGDAVEYLESCAPGSLDGFTLSNILDGPEPEYADRLMEAVRRTASPGAQLILRSFGEPASRPDAAWAARDRAMLWGSVRVETVEN